MSDNPEVISTYPDAQAVDDGDLVQIGRKGDRITHNLFAWLVEHLPRATDAKPPQPPQRWPVALLLWSGASTDPKQGQRERAVAACIGLCASYRTEAQTVWETNAPSGGILKLWPKRSEDEGRTIIALDIEGDEDAVRIWILPNGNGGGVTAMFPEDY